VEAYQQTESALKEFFYDRHRALVEIRRKAEVIIELQWSQGFLHCQSGAGNQVRNDDAGGLKDVGEDVVLAELTYKAGEPFSGTALKNTEQNLRALDLFSLWMRRISKWLIRVSIKPTRPANFLPPERCKPHTCAALLQSRGLYGPMSLY
jgi:hypothetical protein